MGFFSGACHIPALVSIRITDTARSTGPRTRMTARKSWVLPPLLPTFSETNEYRRRLGPAKFFTTTHVPQRPVRVLRSSTITKLGGYVLSLPIQRMVRTVVVGMPLRSTMYTVC